MCEAKTLPPDDGAPFVLCAVTGAICVGFPSEPVWDRDQLPVDFLELLSDGTLADAHEEIYNLTRSVHAGPIVDRHLMRLRHQCSDATDLWNRREQIFPRLTFGPDVEGHLAEVNAGWLPTLVNRLADLKRGGGGVADRRRARSALEDARDTGEQTIDEQSDAT